MPFQSSSVALVLFVVLRPVVAATSSSLAVPVLRRLPPARFFRWYSRSRSRFACTESCSCFFVLVDGPAVAKLGVECLAKSSTVVLDSSPSPIKSRDCKWLKEQKWEIEDAKWGGSRYLLVSQAAIRKYPICFADFVLSSPSRLIF